MSQKLITNPILPGFNPDPSIVRVNDDFFIATSTFEWFPGVQIHHSRDLIHWRLTGHALTRTSQLNMTGNADSGGVWAPCLSYDRGIFYLVYTDVKNWKGAFKETHNYLVTAPDITGPWSEPIYLNSSGFDPSLFHDDDGRKWLVNMLWDFRAGKNPFAGIVLQEFSMDRKRLTGPVTKIFEGTGLGCTEGPHIYKKNGYYYLMTAEGGTSYAHAVTMARAKSIAGPYEADPANPVLTSHGPVRGCKRPDMHPWLSSGMASVTSFICAAARSRIRNGAFLDGKRRFRNAIGTRMAGCAWPPAGIPLQIRFRPRSCRPLFSKKSRRRRILIRMQSLLPFSL